MKYLILSLLAFSLLSFDGKSEEKKTEDKVSKAIVSGEVEELQSGFKFTEGPAVDAQGNVYFSDVQQRVIFIWTIENELDTFRLKSGRSNGLFFDKDENLLACEGQEGRITMTSPTGEYKSIASEYNGARFNQTNDLWSDPKGGIYFTDPLYGGGKGPLPQDGMHVYYISPDHSSVTRVCDDFEKPNGVLGTPDGKILYVTDAQAKKTYQYAIQADGSLTGKTLFAAVGCDGMTVDKAGNVYLTTSGKSAVDIFSPSGQLLETIPLPQSPTNVCFGGKERNQLFITARKSLYRIELNAYGVD